jgi:O-antigen/teichoic acid export membrane protein
MTKRSLKSRGLRRSAVEILLRETVLLLVSKIAFKGFIFFALLIAAKRLSQVDFGDFQLLNNLVNAIVLPGFAISLVVARIGCAFPALEMRENLSAFHLRFRKVALLAAAAIWVAFMIIEVPLSHLVDIRTRGAVILAGLLTVLNLLLNYYIGFFQALERFHPISVSFLMMGVLTLLFSGLWYYFDLSTILIYSLQASAVLLTVIFNEWLLSRILPVPVAELKWPEIEAKKFTLITILASGAFFAIFYMDLFVAKMFLPADSAGYYARFSFIGKISFLMSSTLATIIFPRVAKAFDAGQSSIRYLLKSGLALGGVSAVAFVLSVVLAPYLSTYLFGHEFQLNAELMYLILITGTLQSLLYLLLNYAIARMNTWVPTLMCVLMLLQAGIFGFSHKDVKVITLIPLVIVLLALSILGTYFLITRRSTFYRIVFKKDPSSRLGART